MSSIRIGLLLRHLTIRISGSLRYTYLGHSWLQHYEMVLSLSDTLSKNKTAKIGSRSTFTLLVRSKKTKWTILFIRTFFFIIASHHETDCVVSFSNFYSKVRAERDAIILLRAPTTHYGKPNWNCLFPSIVGDTQEMMVLTTLFDLVLQVLCSGPPVLAKLIHQTSTSTDPSVMRFFWKGCVIYTSMATVVVDNQIDSLFFSFLWQWVSRMQFNALAHNIQYY